MCTKYATHQTSGGLPRRNTADVHICCPVRPSLDALTSPIPRPSYATLALSNLVVGRYSYSIESCVFVLYDTYQLTCQRTVNTSQRIGARRNTATRQHRTLYTTGLTTTAIHKDVSGGRTSLGGTKANTAAVAGGGIVGGRALGLSEEEATTQCSARASLGTLGGALNHEVWTRWCARHCEFSDVCISTYLPYLPTSLFHLSRCLLLIRPWLGRESWDIRPPTNLQKSKVGR